MQSRAAHQLEHLEVPTHAELNTTQEEFLAEITFVCLF